MRPSPPEAVPTPPAPFGATTGPEQLAYTVRDTPQVQRRIEADLALVLRTVRAGDPGLRALVLTGGFARGEGMVRGGAPQNDYDLVALRGLARPKRPYAAMRAELEKALGLHLDLQPVWTGRLPYVSASIFWYETALRGRALWGPSDLLRRIPHQDPARLDRTEGLRLLVNRAAGLLLAEPERDADLHRLQACKAFLAALDAHLLAAGAFAPSQRERWDRLQGLLARDAAPRALVEDLEWLRWAFAYKTLPEEAPVVDGREAWLAAAGVLLDAVPVALQHAGLTSLQDYVRADRPLENLVYRLRAGAAPGARRWAAHPTGHVRAATFALLAARCGRGSEEDAQDLLTPVLREVPSGPALVDALRQLRDVTLQ